jgi:HEPN domain-containing protein
LNKCAFSLKILKFKERNFKKENMERKEVKLLKSRALNFLANAKDLFKKKIFDISAFNIEQFCQLYLKYFLLIKIGDFPKTHSIRELLIEVGKISNEKKIRKFLNENIDIIKNLENAYITSRYIPITFSENEVKRMLDFSKKFKRFVDGL